MPAFKEKLADYAEFINSQFSAALPYADPDIEKVINAMLYSLKIGGKRIRPIIMLEFYKLCGGNASGINNFAIALEMIHTYSLIHDDLPCMDNDDFRRGKPACHKAFGEAAAVLAGDGLLTEAFLYAASAKDIPQNRVVSAIRVLAECAGASGMIGGQVIDLENEGKNISIETLKKLYSLKTGALIKAAAKIGCILAGAEDKIPFAECYAENVGLAFQIVDDILDAVGDEKSLGKPLHSDEKNNKTTYVNLLGVDNCREKVKELTNAAKENIDKIGIQGEFLKDLADYLALREF